VPQNIYISLPYLAILRPAFLATGYHTEGKYIRSPMLRLEVRTRHTWLQSLCRNFLPNASAD